MRRYSGTRGRVSQSRFVGLAAVVALAVAATMLVACGSTPSTAGGGGGGGSGEPQLTLSPNQAKKGQVLTVRGTSMPKGETDPIVRGELVAVTPEGDVSLTNVNIFNQTFSQSVSVPDQLAPGDYTITLKLKGEQAGKEVSAKLTILP